VFEALTKMPGYSVNATSGGFFFGENEDKQATVPLLHLAIIMLIINQDDPIPSLNILRTVLKDR